MFCFSKVCETESVGYCIYHDGYIRPVNLWRRQCLEKWCKYCVIFTERAEDLARTAPPPVQTYTGNPAEFAERYRGLIDLKRPQNRVEEDDEPECDRTLDVRVMSYAEILENARFADERRRKKRRIKKRTRWRV